MIDPPPNYESAMARSPQDSPTRSAPATSNEGYGSRGRQNVRAQDTLAAVSTNEDQSQRTNNQHLSVRDVQRTRYRYTMDSAAVRQGLVGFSLSTIGFIWQLFAGVISWDNGDIMANKLRNFDQSGDFTVNKTTLCSLVDCDLYDAGLRNMKTLYVFGLASTLISLFILANILIVKPCKAT